jgi:hypothetical protein
VSEPTVNDETGGNDKKGTLELVDPTTGDVGTGYFELFKGIESPAEVEVAGS